MNHRSQYDTRGSRQGRRPDDDYSRNQERGERYGRPYDDDSPRETGWVTFKTMGAAWVFVVKDPDSGNSFQFVAETFDKGLDGISLLLACEDAPWASDPFLKKKKACNARGGGVTCGGSPPPLSTLHAPCSLVSIGINAQSEWEPVARADRERSEDA